MELYLLRHGESSANARQLVCGSLDFPLSKKGEEQAALICQHLSKITFNRIYVSSLSRAINTVSKLEYQAEFRIENQLKELNTGDVSYLTLPELWANDARYRKPWLSPDLRYPGGETFREMITRISNWFNTNAPQWKIDDKVLIVGHEGTLRVIHMLLQQLTIDAYPDFPIGNCDYLYYELDARTVCQHAHIALSSLSGAHL
jgi:broad specificity phosphatase PhoE